MQKQHPAQNLVYELKEQMPTVNQKLSFESISESRNQTPIGKAGAMIEVLTE